MKKLLFIALVAMVFASCKKNDLITPTQSSQISLRNLKGSVPNTPSPVDTVASKSGIEPLATNLVPIITQGSWYISAIFSPIENKTSSYSKVSLTVTTSLYGGSVVLDDSGKITNGSWTSQGIVYYGVPASFGLREWSFNLGKSYSKLSQSWIIREISANRVIYDSANPAEGATLVLRKK
jgi:hypothetical protein